MKNGGVIARRSSGNRRRSGRIGSDLIPPIPAAAGYGVGCHTLGFTKVFRRLMGPSDEIPGAA